MARSTESACHICRRENLKMYLKGDRCYSDKCAIERRPYPPGQHGQGRVKFSEYGVQLREKQKVKLIFFAYFYTAVTFNPVDVADNLKKHGGYIPGVRPGKQTSDYIDKVLTRITFGGAIYLSLVCVLPTIIMNYFGVSFYFGGTSLLIVVGVALDTVQQIEGHLITRNYEGFTGAHGPRIRGRSAPRLPAA